MPQNILGLFMLMKYKNNNKESFFDSLIIYHDEAWGGVSLGMFIFMTSKRDEKWVNETKVHEYGHFIQSLILGPLYLFVIGIPSYIWCNRPKYKKIRKDTGKSYFAFYPERWANYLGQKITKMKAPK